MKLSFLITFMMVLVVSCITDKNKLTVSGTFKKKTSTQPSTSGNFATFTTINHTNDQLIINGENFSGTAITGLYNVSTIFK